MPITIFVRSGESERREGAEHSLTFDGMRRIAIGRGSSSDVRLPDPSVSHRHATVELRGADFILVDEESTNGTFVGGARIPPRTSRVLRSGDLVRVGRVWLEARVEQAPITRDVAGTTREIALALVSEAMGRLGETTTTRVRVVEGDRDLGATLLLDEEGRAYSIGRAAECDLPLSDDAASREHVQIVRRGSTVLVRDLGSKNPALLGDVPLDPSRDVVWRPAVALRVARTVIALEEPVGEALIELESAPDEILPIHDGAPAPPPRSIPESEATPSNAPPSSGPHPGPSSAAPIAPAPPAAVRRSARKKGAGWGVADIVVMLAALAILGLSIAGLVWLLRG
jgi:pSer/pThr/pTyr-binding forkhead associated (FHA) protein